MKISTLLALSALSAPILATGKWSTVNCYPDQKQIIQDAINDVSNLALSASGKTGTEAFKKWFGNIGEGYPKDSTVNYRLEGLATLHYTSKETPKNDVVFDCNGNANKCCSAGTIGGVPACQQFAGDEYIYLCSGFFNWRKERIFELAPPSGKTNKPTDSDWHTRGYLLFHELMHAQYKSADVRDKVKGCYAYGHRCALKLAKLSAVEARKNADNYATFAVAAYYGLSHWQLNPDYVET